MNISLWIAQIVLAALFAMGAVMKLMAMEKMASKMPWMGQLPPLRVRLLGVVDLVAAVGLILPALLNKDPQVTAWTAIGAIVLMACAIAFHLSRGEKDIWVNIFVLIIAVFVAWGRWGV